MKKLLIALGIIGAVGLATRIIHLRNDSRPSTSEAVKTTEDAITEFVQQTNSGVPSISALRSLKTTTEPLFIEETLEPGSNYNRYRASYESEGFTMYGLLTIPKGQKPVTGWPLIIFNHGYIPPNEYRTTERYIAYTDGFSRNGYMLFRPDYRGHDKSQGTATGAYGSNAYTIDVLNAIAATKLHPDADPNRIGMWGHSMGGFIGLRTMIVSKDIKAGVIWGGVVASYPDLLDKWRRSVTSPTPTPVASPSARRWRQVLTEQFGTPEANPEFWASISANSFLDEISGPVQLHHGNADTTVPVEFSENLSQELKAAGKEVELYTYNGDDHNISKNFSVAMRRSIEFFDRYVKQENPVN
jgi:dipeptidyl aminopeptidase/acylaminoacyl peptidase